MSTFGIFTRLLERNQHNFESILFYLKLIDSTRAAINYSENHKPVCEHHGRLHNILVKEEHKDCELHSKLHKIVVEEEKQYDAVLKRLFDEFDNIHLASIALGDQFSNAGAHEIVRLSQTLEDEEHERWSRAFEMRRQSLTDSMRGGFGKDE